ncbi:CsbD family protein [Bradyrhizobium sp. 139]|uniref:CsbD family protein n=1 Tax=Bradyrhizobium sp. 139 TaxID=2782616 RepID=UPI001FFA25A7|nr:CsbD family protein [Bradyrhizobium sp. 139]
MGKTSWARPRIFSNGSSARQAVGEIIGDQNLHDDGKAQAGSGPNEQDKPRELNPLKKLRQLT